MLDLFGLMHSSQCRVLLFVVVKSWNVMQKTGLQTMVLANHEFTLIIEASSFKLGPINGCCVCTQKE